MYIWIGCKLPAEFEKEIRSQCLARNRHIELDTDAFSLPQHISLKISFQSQEPDAVLAYLEEFLKKQKSFTVRIQSPEQAGSILWMPVEQHTQLQMLHAQLDASLEHRFGIPQHEFDKAFLFHSTLFIDENTEKLAIMREALAGFPLPRELIIDTFLLGMSKDGTKGSFRIVRTIEV